VERGAGADKLAALRAELGKRLCGFFSTPDELAGCPIGRDPAQPHLGRTPSTLNASTV
jgi:hypothetical protein